MKHLTIYLSILLIIVGCGSQQTNVETNVEVPVSVDEVILKSIEEFVTTTGTVGATKDYMVTSETAGFYRLAKNPQNSKPFILGDFVKKDQVIIYLENPEQENSIRIESQKLNLDISQSEYEKQQSLYEIGGITLRELKNAESSYIDSKYSYDNAQIQLSKLKITAPFDGIIIDIPYYTEGVKVGSGSEMIHIMDYSTLTMEISIPGKLLGQVIVNQPIRVVNYTIPDKTLTGKITQVSPALDPETRTFKVMVMIDNPDFLLRPGMFVKADIIVASKDSTIVIPKDIMLTRRNRRSVFVVEQGFARERVITEGLENPDVIEVVEGLSTGERLVVDGFETLRDGSRVKVVQ